MGVGRRMRKQGPPASLEELGIKLKRKAGADEPKQPARKRRKSDEKQKGNAPKKLVNLDRTLRDESATVAKKPKGKKKIVNNDAQITVPPPFPIASEPVDGEYGDEEDEGQESEAGVAGVPLNEASLSDLDDEDDELDEADLDGEPSDDSVFDSDPDEAPRRMFSDDEDESDAEAKLTAANIEGLSRKLDQQQAQVDAEAQEELEDAIQTNIATDEGVLDSVTAQGLAPDLGMIRTRMTETIRILGNFSQLADKNKSRTDYTEQLLSDICTYYGYTRYLAEKLFNLFTPAEAFAFFEANETPRPVVLRTNTLRTNRRTLAQALINRGVVLEPVGKWSKVGLQVFEAPVPLGATPEYLAGHYILQAASSFLPVMALAPQPNERILDMAAAPGGKTTYISALMRNTGAVFANDANRQRAKGLIGNIHRLGCKNTIICNYDAQKAFPKILGGFDRVLLDAPCSGTGVIGKDPSVKTSKNERDFLALPHMQKQLLLAAIDSTDHTSKTGGYIVYSTCSVTVEENEGVVQYVLRKRPNVKIVDTGLGTFGSEGFKSYMNKKFDDKMVLTRRYFPHKENVDGFFVCKLKKTGPTPKSTGQSAGRTDAEQQTAVLNGDAKSILNGVGGNDEEQPTPGDDFGGFDDEKDKEHIERAEKKWLKSRGIDPRVADRKKAEQGQGNKKKGKSSDASRTKDVNGKVNHNGEKQNGAKVNGVSEKQNSKKVKAKGKE
ncbi:ribosomal RNA small subunit methyltransferase B [Cladophialophora carrionii CBS 160.54]|uniref:Nucleolar protein 2 n=1 Tax=Cladophialophora carrionii CBS 160.54 TaxID=1279043 RepID=V9DCY3_9EURO|nr:ribosomal RNA small subunit methyltransferase B [Cladophialophora carrionii CBS 160.54]ETI24764.1 ribosomal RNA small subunit methyltransferase B [Cladophialophora carrionii CBS 160.54]